MYIYYRVILIMTGSLGKDWEWLHIWLTERNGCTTGCVMPVAFQFDLVQGLVVSCWTGRVSDDDLVDSYGSMYGGGVWQPGFNELSDLRCSDCRCVTSLGLRRLAEITALYAGISSTPFRTAVIAPRDLPFGIARTYEGIAGGQEVEAFAVFREPAAAIGWLGLSDPESAVRLLATFDGDVDGG